MDSSPFSQDTIHTLVRPSFMADLNQRIEKLLPDIENLIARLSDDQREGSISSLLATTEVTIASLGRVLESLEQKDSPLEFLIGAESGQTVQDILLEAHELIADVRTKVISGEQGSIVQVLSTVDATIAAILPSLQHLQEFSAGLQRSPRIGDILTG
ncbi:MAG: hypothetical protein LR015_04915, partial [Verrucomicrobia bacterium]|nr:hypothetical protein [Verrucomicrobiota bacterium]